MVITVEFDVPDDTQFMFCTLDYLREVDGELQHETQEKYTGEIRGQMRVQISNKG